MKFKRNVSLISKIVLVDGQGRSGKSMLASVIGSFDSIQIERIEPIYEYIALLDKLKKIDRDAAVQILQLRADMHLYESMISRNSNFRFRDQTSIFKNPRKWVFIKRLFSEDGQKVVDEIKTNKPIFQILTHDALSMIEPFFEAFENKLRILQIIRHPTYLIYSWYNRGWGRRITEDPRSFAMTLESNNGETVPWYPIKNYFDLSEIDRIVQMISTITKKTIDSYQALDSSQKKQICWIVFEDFVENPEPDIVRIENFIGTKRTKYTNKQLKNENCPREFDKSKYLKIEKYLFKNMNEDSKICYEKLCNIYNMQKENI